MRYSLGLDIGITSVGWAVLKLDENDNVCGIVKMGGHTFNESTVGKEKKTAASARRSFRASRRLVRRRTVRIQRVKKLLQDMNVITKKDLEDYYSGKVSDIYLLRMKSIEDYVLNEKELAQILIYFAKHRGYKSKSVVEEQDSDAKKVLSALSENKSMMLKKGYRTVGEMLYKDSKFRQKEYGDSKESELLVVRNSEGNYSKSIGRELLVEEVQYIFNRQRELGSCIATVELEQCFLDIMQSQRNYDEGPGKGSPYGGNLVEKMVGYCSFEKNEKRACKATYTSERFVLLEKLNHLKILQDNGEYRFLSDKERADILEKVYKTKKITYSALRTILGLSVNDRFNGLTYKREKQKSDEDISKSITKCVSDTEKAEFISLNYWHDMKAIFNLSCVDMSEEWINKLDQIGTILTYYKSDNKRIEKLAELGVEQEIIEKLLKKDYKKFHRLSLVAMKKILPYLEEGAVYSEACSRAGYIKENAIGTSRYITKEVLNDTLDSIMNPTVKRAVRRTVRIINALIKEYGSPVEVHIEMARDISHSKEVKKKIQKQQAQNKKEKEAAEKFIRENIGESMVTSSNVLRYRLWLSQSQMDIYSAKMIPVEDVFDIKKYEVDHIIPYSRSFNDSFSNKMLVRIEDNQVKKNRTPFEYIGDNEETWNRFVGCVNAYVEDSVKRRNMVTKAKDSDEWMSRNLNDTRYISRVVTGLIRENLRFEPYVNEKRKKHVYPVNGQITAKLRYEWGIEKNREDSDKHHAQDAVVIAACTDAMIHQLSEFYKLEEENHIYHSKVVDKETGEIIGDIKKNIPYPWPCFRAELEMYMADNPCDYIEKARKHGYDGPIPKPIFISRLPLNKKTGKINEATIHSKRMDTNEEEKTVHKVSLQKLKLNSDGEIENYYRPEDDRLLYNRLRERLLMYDGDAKKAFETPIYKPRRDGTDGPIVKKVKLWGKATEGLVHINRGAAERGGLYRVDIYRSNNKFFYVPVYYRDVYEGTLPIKAVVAKKKISDWKTMDESEFCFSLVTDSLVRYVKNGVEKYGYFKTHDRDSGAIKVKSHDQESKDYIVISIQKLDEFEKMNVDILGNIFSSEKNEREWDV